MFVQFYYLSKNSPEYGLRLEIDLRTSRDFLPLARIKLLYPILLNLKFVKIRLDKCNIVG